MKHEYILIIVVKTVLGYRELPLPSVYYCHSSCSFFFFRSSDLTNGGGTCRKHSNAQVTIDDDVPGP